MPAILSATAPPAGPVRRRRRWLRRGLAGLAVILVVLVVFHRPLGHWAIRHFGAAALAKAGIAAEWKTSGSLWGGLVVDELKLTGNDTAEVRSVTLRHAALEYDLGALRGGGSGTLLKRLVVQDLDVDLDLSRPRPPRPATRSAKPGTQPQLPEVVLPEVRIEHVTLRLRLPHDVLVVRNFSMVLDPAKPGVIVAELLELPGIPRLQNLRGVTRWAPQRLVFENMVLRPDTVIDKLVLDLADLAKHEAAVELTGHQGSATLALTGRSGAWFTSTTADLKLDAASISQETLAFWGVPSGETAWRAGRLQLSAKGPVLRPDLLETHFTLSEGSFSINDTMVSPIQLEGGMQGGRFTLTNLGAALGGNQFTAKGGTVLPASWAGIAKVAGELDFRVDAPQLEKLLPSTAGVDGMVEGQGRVGFAEAKLTEATADLKAAALMVQGIPVESAHARLRLAGGVLLLEDAGVLLNGQNTLTASGQWVLGGTRRLDVQWQAAALDLATVPAAVRAGMPWPGAGRVLSQGKASGLLAEWQAGDWASLQGQATVEVDGLKVKEAGLDSLRLRADAKDGALRVEELSIRLDAENRLDASGSLDLEGADRPLSGMVALRLPSIAKASAWSTLFGGPALRSGKVEGTWQGQGQWQPLHMDSTGDITVQGLQMEGVPEVLGLTAAVTQSGGDINLSKLKATAGPWRVEGSAHWDGWHLTIPRLEAFAKDQRLADLAVRVPWHDGTVPPDSPVSLHLKVKGLDASKLAAALGRPFPVQGQLTADGDFEGTLRTLQGALTAEATQVKPVQSAAGPKLEPATVKLAVQVQQGQLTLDGTALQRPLQPARLTASLPLGDLPALLADPGQVSGLPLAARVNLPSSSLAFLPSWIPGLRAVEGTAAAEFSLSGTVGRPIWQGSATVLAPQASFHAGSLPTVKDLKLRVMVDERRLVLNDASVMLAGGRLRVEGGAGLDNPLDPTLDLKLTADEVLVVRDENLSLRANAGITCRGPVSKADVRGQIDLVRGRVFKEIEFLPLSLPNDLPPPPPSTTLGKQGPPALPAPFDQWSFDIAIRTRDPIRLMGNVARGNAVADLKLAGSGAKPELTGRITLEEMWLKLPFSRLKVTEGSLSFTREQPFDPQIDVTGESITGGRIVQVFVQGRALDPKVRLTSSPPLPEGEIAALLATGVTTSDLTSSGDEAAGRAAFVLLKQTYRKLFRQAATVGDDDEPPRLSFDFSVFGSDPSRRGVSAIYELNPNWRIIGRVGETGSFRGLLHYMIRFR